MKILHIVAGMPPESGVAAVVARLAVEQWRLGCDVAVATCGNVVRKQREVLKCESSKVLKLEEREGVAVGSNSGQLEERNIHLRGYGYGGQVEHSTLNFEHRTKEKQVRVVTFRRNWPHFLYFSWGMLWGLGKMVKDADVVHVHSNWTFPVWWGAWLALRQKKTLVMSPHGAFNPLQLKHSAWKKKAVGWMDRWLLRRADVVHATCEEENAWIQAFLGKCSNARMRECGNGGGTPRQGEAAPRPKIVVVPNGVEVMRECSNA